MDDSDEAIVAQVQAGDPDAFRSVVERYSPNLFRLVYRMTGNLHDTEDLVQESFVRAYQQLSKFEARAGFGTWLHRITTNCALDFLRRRQSKNKRMELPSPNPGLTEAPVSDACPPPDQALCQAEIVAQVELALDLLTPLERTAFVLRHFEQCSIEEIGRTLSLSESAAKQAIFRAVQKVRRALDPILRTVNEASERK
jgi:RNA polymerase sigma-70 factor (ECF subfamily)